MECTRNLALRARDSEREREKGVYKHIKRLLFVAAAALICAYVPEREREREREREKREKREGWWVAGWEGG